MNNSNLFTSIVLRAGFGLGLALILLLAPLKAQLPPFVRAINENPDFPRQYAPGASATLSGQDSQLPTGLYQWLHDGAPIPGATTRDLLLQNLTSRDTGNYRLQNTNGAVSELSDTLTINVGPFPPSPVDSSFVAQIPHAGGNARILGVMADGRMYIRTNRDDSLSGEQIVRLQNTGSLDPTFPVWRVDYSNPHPILALYPDGRVIVPLPSQSFRLAANGSTNPLPLPAGFDSSKPLTAAAVQPDGRLLIAQGNRLARLNTDDSVDSSFNYMTTLSPLHEIEALTLDSTGLILVKAIEHQSNSSFYPPSWYVITRVLSNGTEDSRFVHFTDDHAHSGEPTAYPLTDGRILVLGSDNIGSYPLMLSSTGAVDSSWSFQGYLNQSAMSPVAVDPTGRFFYKDLGGALIRRAKITLTGVIDDGTFYQGDGWAWDLRLTADGLLLVSGGFTAWDGHLTTDVARLRSTDIVSFPPVASISPDILAPNKGSAVSFTSKVTGTGPFTYQWIALDGQPLPPDVTSDKLVITFSTRSQLGRYQLRVTGPGGVSALSNAAEAAPESEQPHLENLSGRAVTGKGEDTVIAGLATRSIFYTTSHALLRGGGPALKPFGVNNFLSNPAIDLYGSGGTLIANNDQWSVNPETAAAAAAVGAFSFGQGSNDAALVHDFPTGTATLMLKNQGQGDGIGLLEIYQLPYGPEESHAPLDLLNLSFRAHTYPGEGTATAGFVIVDPQGFDRPVKVLLRAIGPTLGSYGITHPLANPILTLYNSKGEVVATNDDWAVNNSSADTATLTAAMKQVGAFDLTADSKDSALLLNLPAGAYSMQATGGSGVVLLEIYLVK
jgi:hypothetical protein